MSSADMSGTDSNQNASLTVAVTGSSGLVGSALCRFLEDNGHTVIKLVRRKAQSVSERQWDPQNPAENLLHGVQAVVHLAGESIAGRFTEKHKRAIRDSRITPTRLLAALAAQNASELKVFASASAIGIYGTAAQEKLTEASPHATDFLARVVADWEAALAPAEQAGIRTAMIRTGIVQSAKGGSLKLYRPLFALGLGGAVAGGKQWVSWIDLDDLVEIYYRAIIDVRIAGPVNAVAPHAVKNAEYAKTLARVLRRPAFFAVPALAPRLVLGVEGSRSLVEGGQRVEPAVLKSIKHVFRYSHLEDSLRHQLKRN